VVIDHPLSASSIDDNPWHPPCSVYMPDSLLAQSLSKFSLVYLVAWQNSTSYSIHFFIQSLSSFRSTCPYHHYLFSCSTEIMSSNPSLSLNPLLGTLSCCLMPHISSSKCHSLCLAPVNPDWFYLLVPAYPGSPRHSPGDRKMVLVVMPHIHLAILISAAEVPGLNSMQHTTLHTTAV